MIIRSRHLVALAALLSLTAAFWLTPSNADAAGLFLPGRGVKPLGRGGAFVVSGDGDLNSLWYNPANLALLEGTTLTVDLSLIDLSTTFQRAPRTRDDGSVITTYDPVSNEAPPLTNPQLLVGGKLPFGSDKLRWAFGLYAPYTTPQTYPEDGAQRYTLVDTNGSIVLYSHLALAWQPHKNVRLGVGVQNLFADIGIVSVTSGYAGAFGDPEDADLDVLTRVNMSSAFNPTGNFGVWFRLSELFETALSVQLPVTIRDDAAKVEARLPTHPAFDDTYLDGDTLALGITLPMILRAGGRVKHGRFDYELAFVYELWSAFEQIQIDPNDIIARDVRGVGDLRIAPLAVPLNYRDTFSLRNGVEYTFSETLRGRAGYIFEQSAIPDEYYSVFLPDSTKHVLTLGGSYAGEDWALDLAAAYYHMPDREITSSQVRQINPTDDQGDYTLVVANGRYAQRYLILGAGFTYKF